MAITLDENGNIIDYFAERNEQIKQKLQPILDEFLIEKKMNMNSKKPTNLGYRFLLQLNDELMKYPPLTLQQVAMIEPDELWSIWQNYHSLLTYYNRFFEIVHNKQIFCLYCGINDRIFLKWQESENEDIRTIIGCINTNYIGTGWVASESGNAPPMAVKQRLGAKNVGHNVVSTSEELIADKLTQQSTPQELKRQIEAIIGNEVKLIDKK